MHALLGADSPGGLAFRQAFAAQYNHHAYRSGLLEHSLQVADATASAAAIFPAIDRDLAVCGALLHDIGKLETYTGDEHAVELNDIGKLIGEIPAGYYLVRRHIEDLPHSRRLSPRRCCTSSCLITAAWSTAARCCRSPARRCSSTPWTSSAATSAALTASSARLPQAIAGLGTTGRLAARFARREPPGPTGTPALR
jgi:putative nucleotidyltransferase with HDIG domain